MPLKHLTFLVPILAICATLAAEEKPAVVKEATIIIDAGKPWGEITVKLTPEKKNDALILAALTITTAAGKKIEVPKEALAGLDFRQAPAMTITQDADAKDGPWLYLHILYGNPIPGQNSLHGDIVDLTPPLSGYAEAIIAIRDTKVMYREDGAHFPNFNDLGLGKKVWEAQPAPVPAK